MIFMYIVYKLDKKNYKYKFFALTCFDEDSKEYFQNEAQGMFSTLRW